MEQSNTTRISGQIIKVYPLRETPAGINVLSFVLEHLSRQVEGGIPRTVKCRLYCIIVNAKIDTANNLEQQFVELTGFLSQNSKAQLVLHVSQLNFLDRGY